MKRITRKTITLLTASLLLAELMSGCEFIRSYRTGDAVASAGGQKLYESDLQLLTAGLHGEDSIRSAEAYIRQWVTEQLVYDKARRHASDGKRIEALAEDYRRSLYVHDYEEQLVRERMPKLVAPDTVQAFYDSHSELFTLNENLLQGVLVVTPKDAPDQMKASQWISHLTEENLELLEKYAWQYASGYELFTDRWQTQSGILMLLPTDNNTLNALLKKEHLIQMEDSTNAYLLRVTDIRWAGQPMPIEYAKPDIEQLILSERQAGFLKKQREMLYNQAVRQGKVETKVKE
ncbi:MAG: peptidyl-prolyl cis-trans isomerase [Paludibacteraceae bacterium]|nr:peptidyl-prolyl cis-trans isomerase [Paludibacteraceae bacterium]